VKDIANMLALYCNIGSEEGVACLPTSCRSCQEPGNNRDVTVQVPRKKWCQVFQFQTWSFIQQIHLHFSCTHIVFGM